MAPSEIPVVILCGGLGTRLREETEARPKPMIEIGHAPILWHVMKIYSHHGFRRFVLCLGYKGHVIKDFFRNFEYWEQDLTIDSRGGDAVVQRRNGLRREAWEVTLAETGQDTMTGGRLHRIERYVGGDVFMATYGDGLADIDLTAALRFHLSHRKVATLSAVRPQSRFGVLELDHDGGVTSFREKPLLEEWVNGGFYVFDRRVFEYLEPDSVLEHEPLVRLSTDRQLMAYRHPGRFYAMDTYRDFVALNKEWDGGRAGWKIWT